MPNNDYPNERATNQRQSSPRIDENNSSSSSHQEHSRSEYLGNFGKNDRNFDQTKLHSLNGMAKPKPVQFKMAKRHWCLISSVAIAWICLLSISTIQNTKAGSSNRPQAGGTASSSSSSTNAHKPATAANKALSNPATPASQVNDEKAKYIAAIRREIDARERSPSIELISGDEKAAVAAAILNFSMWGKLYAEGNQYNFAPSEETKRQLFRKLAEKAQAEAYPKVRSMQANLWRNAMWENDIDVEVSGRGNTRLTLRGGLFFTHKAMKAALDGMQETVALLHFSRVTFEAYRGSEQTYFSFDPIPDDQLALIEDQGWTPIPR